MVPRRRKSPVYWRERGGTKRAYGDFRNYADVGGGREALVARGSFKATTNPELAEQLAAERLEELRHLRKQREQLGLTELPTLAQYASHHLRQKARAGRVTRGHLQELEHRLRVAIEFLGADQTVAAVTVRDLDRYGVWLRQRPNRMGGCLSPGTQRHYLNALSNLYRRAASEWIVGPGYNPVAAMMEKPVAGSVEAAWFEVSDAALVLESARTWQPHKRTLACIYPAIATFLLTGGRHDEVLGLETADISFDRKTVTFRPNQWRRLKTSTSRRVVPLWPQLEEILRHYVFASDAPPGQLLFPYRLTGLSTRPLGDIRKSLDTIAKRAGWKRGEIRSKAFRHTYCAARLQTLDRGAPVSQWTVARELGHGGTQLVDRVYGHLGQVRHRSEVVEYRVEQHAETLGERLVALRGWAANPEGGPEGEMITVGHETEPKADNEKG